MPNGLTFTGIQIKTVTEIVNDISTGLKAIYGSDINLDPSSPDGQRVNLIAQAMIDNLELLASIYNSFDPDTVSGVLQDARYALNGIPRQGGTYTYTPVSVTASKAVTLTGLSDDPSGNTVYTVWDGVNQYYLVTTYSFSGSATTSLSFRAVNIGLVQPTLNTINIPITIVNGITGVNNPLTFTSLGVNEESDLQYKLRRAKSFMIQASSPADAVYSAVVQVANVVGAYVYENATGSAIGSIPAHSIWVIVDGGVDSDVANAIYSKKCSGTPMYGTGSATTISITRVAGNTIDIIFDRPVTQDLYVHFSLSPKIAGATFDTDAIKAALALAMIYKIGQVANSNDIINALNIIEPGAYVTGCQVSLNGSSWTDPVSPTDVQNKFTLSTANITII